MSVREQEVAVEAAAQALARRVADRAVSAQQLIIDRPYGIYEPDYRLAFFRDGNPAKRITAVNWRSTRAINTAKNITDISGTFQISLKDNSARAHVREMDTGIIKLRGHYGGGYITVLKVIVDRVRPGGSADPYASEQSTVIEGRCIAKYLQINSLFLPVWDPQAGLPTALIFGLGDASKKVGGNRPYDINRYLIRHYVYGSRKIAGVAGTPAARHWLDCETRFVKNLGFEIPFLQFDEDDLATAFKRLEVLGFTEAWVDELGRQVYRKPGWNSPVRYAISTGALRDWSYDRGDINTATYVEVIPAGDPGIDSGTAQALRAGRAPVPSSYLTDGTSLASSVDKDFVIDTDRKGHVTDEGEKNHWRRLQRRLGVRPQQITSPLIANQKQAQAQAQGLLEFYARATKSMTVTIPGDPRIRLGYNARVYGPLDGAAQFDRTLYIEGVSHDYVENDDGGDYTTSLTLTHGRDAHDPFTGRPDPKWHNITLPKFDPPDLGSKGGVLNAGDNGGNGGGGGGGGNGAAPHTAGPRAYPLAVRGTLIGTPGVGTHSWSAPPNNWQSDNALDIGVSVGTPVYAISDGTISPSGLGFGAISTDPSSRFGGIRLHLVTAENTWFYQHLHSVEPGIRPGARVSKGQRIGSSGFAVAAHLHLACQHGNPKTLIWDAYKA